MKATEVKCSNCGGIPELCGSGMDDICLESPFYIVCKSCGSETDLWHSVRKAWKQWKEWHFKRTLKL